MAAAVERRQQTRQALSRQAQWVVSSSLACERLRLLLLAHRPKHDTTARIRRAAECAAKVLAPNATALVVMALARKQQPTTTTPHHPTHAVESRQDQSENDSSSPTPSPSPPLAHDLSSTVALLSPSSSSFAASSSPLSSVRRVLRSLGHAAVLHSVFAARSPESGAESATRFACLLGTSVATAFGVAQAMNLTVGLGARVGNAVRAGFSGVTARLPWWRSSASTANVLSVVSAASSSAGGLWLGRLEQLRNLQGVSHVAAVTSLAIGSVASLAIVIRTLEVLGWVRPQRESYLSIASSMAHAGVTFTERQFAALSLPPPERPLGFARLTQLFAAFSTCVVGPVVEEDMATFFIRFLPTRFSGHLLQRACLAASLVGAMHQSFEGGHENVASAALRAALNEIVRYVSPTLPLLVHVGLNYLTLDAYAAISPLRGLHMSGDALAPDESTRELFRDLHHHFDPRHSRPFLALVVAARSTPLLRTLLPGTSHALFARPSKKHSTSWFFGRPRPSPDHLSSHYERVVSELFSVLDTRCVGALTPEQFAFVFLLRPEVLETLRAAFDTLDNQLATNEREHELARIQRRENEERAADGPDVEIGASISRDRRFNQLRAAARANSQPLQTWVIHHARAMPERDAEEDWRTPPPSYPFVCAEWFGNFGAARVTTNKTWLMESLRTAGATKMYDPAHHYAAGHDPSPSGWSRRGPLSWLEYPEELDATPLPIEVAPRFHKLMHMFRAYVDLTVAAAFQSHLDYYGEIDAEQAAAREEAAATAGEEEEATSPPVPRRFTRASLHAWVRDLALQDASATDALLAQCVFTMHGSMPHAMHIYNVAFATFKQ